MHRLVLAASLAALSACATNPKPVPDQPLSQTCSELAKQLENGSMVAPADRKDVVEKLQGLTFHWRLRVLSVSDEMSRAELANGMALNVECLDRPGTTKEGLRYIFTLYFERQISELASLGRGATLTVDGTLLAYEGQGAFAAKAKAYAIE